LREAQCARDNACGAFVNRW